MKSHIFISAGLIIAIIFIIRGIETLQSPGLGLQEAYVLGGFIMSGLLIYTGLKNRKG